MSFEQAVVQLEQTNARLQEEVVRFRDAAMGLNAIYPTITEGRQAVADGKYFSVPGNGAYMRLYRRQGSSAELIAEFPDRAELNSVIDQLGPLLGRGVVGPGDLLAEGAYGLGNTSNVNVPDSNLDTLQVSGVYRAISSTVGIPTSGLYQVQHWQQGAGVAVQLAIETGNISSPRVYVRSRGTSSNWTAWIRLINISSVVGTVSQASGVPTGAIIERGSNANGSYTLFADGFMRCVRTGFSVTRAASNRYQGFWNFPRSFASKAYVGVNLGFSGSDYSDTATRNNISHAGETGNGGSTGIIEVYTVAGYSVPTGASIDNITLVAEGYAF